jgi:hypothetical protein
VTSDDGRPGKLPDDDHDDDHDDDAGTAVQREAGDRGAVDGEWRFR